MEEKTPLQKVVDIFVDYYGEDKIDLQPINGSSDSFILIYFPRVTITNENDRSIDITELYVRIKVDSQGKLIGTFTLNRAEYTIEQWISDYMHSHVRGIPRSSLGSFQSSCLGNGPIVGTCTNLNNIFDEDIWRLFTFELDKYVHTESLRGIPYRYLENVGIDNSQILSYIPINNTQYTRPNFMLNHSILLTKFIHYIIEKRIFSFNFDRGYHIADSDYNIVIKTSNAFIEWYNSLPFSEQEDDFGENLKRSMFGSRELIICKAANEKIYTYTNLNTNYTREKEKIGTPLWYFKDKLLRLNITGIPDSNDLYTSNDENTSILLHPSIVMYIVNKMLSIINYKYGTVDKFNKKEVYI